MSVKNFKITTGLDLDGLVLNVGAGNALYWNNDALATETYVTDAIANSTFDGSGAAGAYLDWDALNNQFNVDAAGLATELTTNQGLATQTDVSNIINDNYGGTTSTYSGYFIDTRFGYYTETSQLDTTIDGYGYIKSSALNGYATEVYADTKKNEAISYTDQELLNYTPTSSLDTTVGGYGYLKSADLPTMYTDSDAVDAIVATLSDGLTFDGALKVNIGNGLTTAIDGNSETEIVVDTTVIATKAYVDGVAQGLDVKDSVVSASTANLDLSSIGSMTQVGGIDLLPDARYLLKDQTDPSQNGIYVFDIATIQLIRATDATFDTATGTGTLTKGAFVFVEGGTSAGKGFVVSSIEQDGNANYYTSWTQFSETGNYITSVSSELDVTNGLLTIGTTLSNKTLESPTITVPGVISISVAYPEFYVDDNNPSYITSSTLAAASPSTLTISGGTVLYQMGGTQNPNQTVTVTSISGNDVYFDATPIFTNTPFWNPVNSVNFGTVTVSAAGGTTTVSSTEISYLDGVTSNIQTQLNAKQGALSAGTGIDISSNTVSVKLGVVAPSGYDLVGTDVDGNLIVPTVDTKQNILTAGNGINIDGSSNISIDLNDIAGTGITVNGNQLEAAPAYITSVDASFAVNNGELSLSDTITIASVELTDSVANVTAASDVFGNADTETYAMGSNQTVGTLPTGTEVADIFITLKDNLNGDTRTSKITAVFTGNDAPTWTEYGIITSGWTFGTTISFDSSKNIIVNADGTPPFAYSVKGVFTTIK